MEYEWVPCNSSPAILRSPLQSCSIRRGKTGVSFLQARVVSTQGESREKKMESQQQQNNTIEDLMDDSDDPFGVEYFTRSDDEGFGLIYISHWKLSDSEDEENNGGHEKHTEGHDKSHGSQVKDHEEVGHQPEKMISS